MKKVVAIIDDDSNIRNLLFDYTKESEFVIIGEQSGTGLIDLFQSYKNDIDILVLDIVIPDLSKIKKFLYKLDQNIQVVIITGYNVKNLIKELQTSAPNKKYFLLHKPFSKHLFLKTLRQSISCDNKGDSS